MLVRNDGVQMAAAAAVGQGCSRLAIDNDDEAQTTRASIRHADQYQIHICQIESFATDKH